MSPATFLGPFLDCLRSVRIAIVIIVLSLLTLAAPEQMLELYIIYAQGLQSPSSGSTAIISLTDFAPVAHVAFAILATVLFTVVLWICTLRLLTITDSAGASAGVVVRGSHEVIATLIGLAPAIALLAGFYNAIAKLSAVPGAQPLFVESYWLKIIGSVLIGLILFNTVVYYLWVRQWLMRSLDHLFSWRGFLGFSVVLLGFGVGILLFPVQLPATLGTLAIAMLFLAALSYILTHFTCLTERYKVPLISMLVILAVGFAVFDLNDNHRVSFTIDNKVPQTLENNFVEWYKQRKDKEYYATRSVPYPIYVISAEGGGLYAAYHTAAFLAQLQDECPLFAQHAFAISSVSGGSLGAAVFSALATEQATNQAWRPCGPASQKGKLNEFVKHYFSQDFLSPLIAASLFPDFLQRFLPVPVYQFDRARALERAFEAAWENAARAVDGKASHPIRNPFETPLSAFAEPLRAAPALLLNTTGVETGSRITLSPLFVGATPTALHITQALLGICTEVTKTVEMRLSTAVSLSARFPWVTPVGWVDRPMRNPKSAPPCPDRQFDFGNRLYLADGGYFENSGLESAIEVAARLRRVIEKNPQTFPNGSSSAEIKVIMI